MEEVRRWVRQAVQHRMDGGKPMMMVLPPKLGPAHAREQFGVRLS
jgi:hypothetical protein